MAPAPRPGTLEWLADQQPDAPVLIGPDGTLTRTGWEARAEALAEHLATVRGVAEGDLLSAGGRIGPDWLTVSWAAAKLGAGLAGLPPGPVTSLEDALHVGADDLLAAHATPPAERRLSGSSAPPDALTFSRLGRPVRRRFHPAGVAAIGATVADLVARIRAVPGTTLVASGPVSDPVATFLVNLVLVGGGRIVTAPEPAAALALAAEHDADLAALPPQELDALGLSAQEAREALDTTRVSAVVTGAAGQTTAGRTAADDLFGAESVIDVYATADTGVVAVRGAGEAHHVLLDGVTVRVTPAGLLEVRSPLAAAPGWVGTGDRAELLAERALRLV
ncbi:MAG: Amino acid adenylation protein [Solirubrobacterales bacterium]|nr:Amino acid adenylation protein [Solirubrobacterales bacterium]